MNKIKINGFYWCISGACKSVCLCVFLKSELDERLYYCRTPSTHCYSIFFHIIFFRLFADIHQCVLFMGFHSGGDKNNQFDEQNWKKKTYKSYLKAFKLNMLKCIRNEHFQSLSPNSTYQKRRKIQKKWHQISEFPHGGACNCCLRQAPAFLSSLQVELSAFNLWSIDTMNMDVVHIHKSHMWHDTMYYRLMSLKLTALYLFCFKLIAILSLFFSATSIQCKNLLARCFMKLFFVVQCPIRYFCAVSIATFFPNAWMVYHSTLYYFRPLLLRKSSKTWRS